MAIQFDENGELEVISLTSEDRKLIVEKAQAIVLEADSAWNQKYGPFETLSLSDMTVEEQNARLDKVDDNLIWADVNYDTGSIITPVEGLNLHVNGWAKVPGRSNFSDTGEDFLIATKPWEGAPYAHEPVYSFAQCVCPFCEQGEIDGEECDGCWGAGVLEFEN